MRRGRILIFVLLIILIGLVVVYFAVTRLLGGLGGTKQAPETNTVEVFVAGQSIPVGTKITGDELATIAIPQDKVMDVEFTIPEKDQLVGMVTQYPIAQGVVITSPMVAKGLGSGSVIPPPPWAAQVPQGMVAFSIPASRLSMASYGVTDGSTINLISCFLFVDVDPSFQTITPNLTAQLTATGFPQNALPILTLGVGGASGPQGRLELDPSLQQPYYLVPSQEQRPRTVCQTILQDVTVMKAGNFALQDGAAQAQQQQQQTAAVAPDVVTLLVSPQDAVTLQYMIYTNAQMMMAFRRPDDRTRLATEAATLQFLLSQYNIPVPAKLPYATQPRIDALAAPVLPNEGAPAAK